MASSALSGGLSAITCLGSVNTEGRVTRRFRTLWKTGDNGNPSNIVDIAREMVSDNVMFTVERDFNKNVCCYVLHPDGRLIPQWLMIPPDADVENASMDDLHDIVHTEELTFLEKKGYGISTKGSQFSLNALKGERFKLVRGGEHPRATVEIEGTTWFVHRIFLHTEPNMVGFPSVKEIHLTVHDQQGKVAQFFYRID